MASERQFTLKKVKKKDKFQDKLMKVHEHQRIPQQIIQLGKYFFILDKPMSTDKDFVRLTEGYGKLDAGIKASIIASAKSVGQTDFGYQRSPELTLAGQTV